MQILQNVNQTLISLLRLSIVKNLSEPLTKAFVQVYPAL